MFVGFIIEDLVACVITLSITRGQGKDFKIALRRLVWLWLALWERGKRNVSLENEAA